MFALTRRCDDVRRRKDAKLCDVQFVKNDLPGLRPKAREDENVEFGKYENIDRLRPKRRNAKGVITPAPRKDSSKLVRSPLSPDYINRTLAKSAQGLPKPSKSNSLQQLAGILAHFFNLGDENKLPRICRQPSGDALQYKTAEKK